MTVDEAINIVGSYFALGTIGQALTEADHAHACWQELCRLVRLGELVENMPLNCCLVHCKSRLVKPEFWLNEDAFETIAGEWHFARGCGGDGPILAEHTGTTPAEALKALEGKK